jgi:hypothetical protein
VNKITIEVPEGYKLKQILTWSGTVLTRPWMGKVTIEVDGETVNLEDWRKEQFDAAVEEYKVRSAL